MKEGRDKNSQGVFFYSSRRLYLSSEKPTTWADRMLKNHNENPAIFTTKTDREKMGSGASGSPATTV